MPASAPGISAAVGWIARNLPVYSMNFVLATADELWAFRYPETQGLFVLEREAGGAMGDPHRRERDVASALRTSPLTLGRGGERAARRHPGWRPLESGELAHVKPDLSVSTAIVVEHAPTQVMHLDHPTGQERS